MDKQKTGEPERQRRAEGRAPKKVTLEPRLQGREGSERAWSLRGNSPRNWEAGCVRLFKDQRPRED